MFKHLTGRFTPSWFSTSQILLMLVMATAANAAPHWGAFSEQQCNGTVRTYFSRLWDITGGNGMQQCQSTPTTVDGANFPGATRCIDKGLGGLWGEVDVPDARCGPITFQGTVKFSETEPLPTEPLPTPRGMGFADVEVWSCGNAAGPNCAWGKVSSGRTDAGGGFSMVVQGPRSTRDQYQVRIIARNEAAIVWQQDTGSTFWTDLLPTPIRATRTTSVLDFSRSFGSKARELFVSRHLNAAQKLLPARRLVLKFRDPTETDTLGRIIVSPILAQGTAYTNSGVMKINPSDMLNERTLVHEYGHFVQESIGAYHLWPAFHDGCFAKAPITLALINSPEYAWFEGFPTFLSSAVRLYFSSEYTKPTTPQLLSDYRPSPCAAIGMTNSFGVVVTPESVEGRASDLLFLLMNDSDLSPKCTDPVGTTNYRNCATPIWDANLSFIMAIMDKELDFSQPNSAKISNFYKAWLARGANREHIDGAMDATGIGAGPVVPPKTPLQICLEACVKQHSECMASAHTGQERGACGVEANTCKAECPR